ncbi:MAG: KpsF/GutQ family sugar-phosphate isomerase [Pseudomonadota bacterium]
MSAQPKSTPAPARGEGARVVAAEADALRIIADALAGQLGDVFDRAVDLLDGAPGRIVATGIGKSGHIARKIAATLASTGAPALYVHPAEASHGDLGMIAASDCLLALSNSGETAELSDILSHCKRIGAPIVAITAGAASTLADAADAALCPPPLTEACPMGLAPMTSTTVALALGDALAAALIVRRGFSAGDFRALHPGGALGAGLIRLRDVMHPLDRTPLVPPSASMADALMEMTAKGLGCVGVRDTDGQLLGVVTDGDLRRHMDTNLLAQPVDAVMTADPHVAAPTDFAAEALRVMNKLKITTLFVVADGQARGVVHIHDLLRLGLS